MIKKIVKNKYKKNLNWDSEKHPHMLIVGATGSGKSYFTKLLIGKIILNQPEAKIILCDFKASNDFDYQQTYQFNDVKNGLNSFIDAFEKRLRNKTSSNIPVFMVFDELATFLLSLDKADSTYYKNKIAQILMLGRTLRTYLVVILQRPDANFFQNGARDNFGIRIGLGRLSNETKKMLFPDTELKEFKNYNGGQGHGFLYRDGFDIEEIVVPRITNMKKLDITIKKGLSSF